MKTPDELPEDARQLVGAVFLGLGLLAFEQAKNAPNPDDDSLGDVHADEAFKITNLLCSSLERMLDATPQEVMGTALDAATSYLKREVFENLAKTLAENGVEMTLYRLFGGDDVTNILFTDATEPPDSTD